MFYSIDNSPTQTKRLTAAFSQRVRDLFALAIAFLTLEDGYEPDWTTDGAVEQPGLTRADGASRRLRHPHREPLTPRAGTRRKGAVAEPRHHCLSPLQPAQHRGGQTHRRRQPASH